MNSDQSLDQLLRISRRADGLRRTLYEAFDARHSAVPATGPQAIDMLLSKAVLAIQLHDHDEARGLVVRATRLPPGPGVPAPPVLWRALRLLGAHVFRSVEADRHGDLPWFDALLLHIERPGDDITTVALEALEAVARVYSIPSWLAERIVELVEENRGPDPAGVVERVLAGRSDERDVVFEVLCMVASVDDSTPDDTAEYEEDEEDDDLGEYDEDGDEDGNPGAVIAAADPRSAPTEGGRPPHR